MKRLSLSVTVTLFFSGLVFASDEAYQHVVQQGESLSVIAQKYIGSPVYPKHTGSLARLLSMNPHISNPALVRAGERVNLGVIEVREPAAEESAVGASTPTASFAAAPAANSALATTPMASAAAPPSPLLPVTAPATLVATEFKPRSLFRWDLGAEYFRIDSKDKSTGGKAVFLSNLSPQTRLTWDLNWTERWSSRVRVGLQSEKILGDEQATKTFNDARGSRASFEVGAMRRWIDSQLGFSIGRSQWIFARGVDASTIAFDRVESFEAKIFHERTLLRKQTVSLGLGLDARLILPGQGIGYTTQTGYGGSGSLILRHEMKNFSVEAQTYYGVFRQNSSLTEQTGSNTGLFLGLTWGME
ncbi:MAG: LysM peptidoglycan-binding domain-containing protein [Bdellovibrionales bacterium]|nr:LysM peptidoglycan-binding domain-containing protein [Bdellovibrionales bacterium]